MRRSDWLQRLDECIAGSRTRVFAYGTFDCALFAADCVLAMTDVDYAADLRGYDSMKDAYKIVARYGGIAEMITALLKCEPRPVALAMRGDVVLAELQLADGGLPADCVGICYGNLCLFPQGKGLRTHRRETARMSWSIS